jgi:hypothetical protein
MHLATIKNIALDFTLVAAVFLHENLFTVIDNVVSLSGEVKAAFESWTVVIIFITVLLRLVREAFKKDKK